MGRTKGRSEHQDSCPGQRARKLSLFLSAGNDADISLAEELTECLPEGSILIGDKAYDSSALRQTAATKGIKTCIPEEALAFQKEIKHRMHSDYLRTSRGRPHLEWRW